jgi:muconolactone D-isomerase
MLYCVEMDVVVPHDVDTEKFEKLKTAEKAFSQKLQHDGKWVHLWRIAGRYANISIFDAADNDELHLLLSALPLFPFMKLK